MLIKRTHVLPIYARGSGVPGSWRRDVTPWFGMRANDAVASGPPRGQGGENIGGHWGPVGLNMNMGALGRANKRG